MSMGECSVVAIEKGAHIMNLTLRKRILIYVLFILLIIILIWLF